MNKNPFFYAFVAAVYIVAIVFVIDTLTSVAAIQQTLLIPMAMLGLFVLSALVMGFLFIYEPLRLHLDDKRQEAIIFFVKTAGTFACFVALFLAVLLYTR